MTTTLAKATRLLQTACPVLVILSGVLLVFSVRDEAPKYPGPPFYLPFIFFTILVGATLGVAALFLWVWRPLGWCLSVLSDLGISLWAAWIVISDVIGKRAAISLDSTLLVVVVCFGSVAVLLFSRQSLAFFQVTETSTVEYSRNSGSDLGI